MPPATKTQQNDAKVKALFDIVKQKKSEIARAEKPNWITNGSFWYDEDTPKRIMIQTVSDLSTLVSIVAFLNIKETSYAEAAVELGVATDFKWLGFSAEDWRHDIRTRINKIQISKKKAELEILETRLNGLISPELKAELELAEIEASLK